MTLELLKELSEIDGTPGFEKEVRDVMKREFNKVADEITFDKLGSVIGILNGDASGPRIMITGHMDETGFMVNDITNDGFIKFQVNGGFWSQVLLSQKVTITTRECKKYTGVIGSKPPHILSPEDKSKPFDIKDMFIDIGVYSKEEAVSLGIRTGDMITPKTDFEVLGNKDFVLGKAWDCRIGCAALIEIMNRLKGIKIPNTLYAVGTVMEEAGCRGAQVSAYKIKPDIGIAIDVGIGNDIPSGDGLHCKLGEGPQILIYDSGTVGHRYLRELLESICDEKKIKYQSAILKGGATDAKSISLANDGTPSLSICLPARYIHSHTSIINLKDFEATVEMLVELIKRLDSKTVQKLTYEY